MLKKSTKKEDACFEVMWDIILASETQEICSLSLTSTGFSFTVVVISILYFCATLFQLLVKILW